MDGYQMPTNPIDLPPLLYQYLVSLQQQAGEVGTLESIYIVERYGFLLSK